MGRLGRDIWAEWVSSENKPEMGARPCSSASRSVGFTVALRMVAHESRSHTWRGEIWGVGGKGDDETVTGLCDWGDDRNVMRKVID